MINTVNQGNLYSGTPVANTGKTLASMIGIQSSGTYRGLGSNWFNAANIAKEDWQRAEQAQNNQLARDLYFQEKANAFNAQEAQKARDYDERMSNSQYQRAVADMKAAGLNPVLALGGNGASFHGASAASSGGSRSSSGNTRGAGGDSSIGSVLGSIASIVAGLYTAGASNATQVAISNAKNATQLAIASGKKNSYSQESYTKKGIHYVTRNYH